MQGYCSFLTSTCSVVLVYYGYQRFSLVIVFAERFSCSLNCTPLNGNCLTKRIRKETNFTIFSLVLVINEPNAVVMVSFSVFNLVII